MSDLSLVPDDYAQVLDAIKTRIHRERLHEGPTHTKDGRSCIQGATPFGAGR